MPDDKAAGPESPPLKPAGESREGLEHGLYQTEQWLRMLIDTAEDNAIFAVDPDGKVRTWNKGAQKLFGYAEAEILGKDFSVLFTPEDRQQGAPAQELVTARQQGFSPDKRWHLRKDGSRLFVSGAVRPLRDRQQQVLGFLKVAHDVTEQRNAEELEAQFRALFESAPGLYLVLEPEEFRIRAVSDAYLAATMTQRDQLVGQRLFEIFPDDPQDPRCDGQRNLQVSLEKVIRERRRDVMPVQFYPVRRPAAAGDGFEERWWSTINTPVLGPKGEVTHIIHRVEDVTAFVRQLRLEGGEAPGSNAVDRRLAEMASEIVLRGSELKRANEELARRREELTRANMELEVRVRERTARLSEKVQELESFSYSLSHDMRAPLRAMQSFAEILRQDFTQALGPAGTELLDRIATSASHLDQLIEDVLSLSRLSRERIELRPVDLDKLVRDLVQQRPAFQPPQAQVEVASPLGAVLGHEASLNQCLSNLLDNAVKFVAPGTLPRVRVRTEPHDGHVRVWVEDNGIGIPEQYSERIFNMFERLHTQERYTGTGIGLSIVRKAVERMGGQAGVEPGHGSGSRFWLELPQG